MVDHEPVKAMQELWGANPRLNPKLARAQEERLLLEVEDILRVAPTIEEFSVLLQGSVVEGGGLPTKGRLRSSVQLHQRASVRYVACLIHV